MPKEKPYTSIKKGRRGYLKLFRNDKLEHEFNYSRREAKDLKLKEWQTMTRNLPGAWAIVISPDIHVGELHLK